MGEGLAMGEKVVSETPIDIACRLCGGRLFLFRTAKSAFYHCSKCKDENYSASLAAGYKKWVGPTKK